MSLSKEECIAKGICCKCKKELAAPNNQKGPNCIAAVKASQQRIYDDRAAKGLCVRGGLKCERPMNGNKLCVLHDQKSDDCRTARRGNRKEQRLCTECGLQLLDDYDNVVCQECIADRSANKMERYWDNIAHGCCGHCGVVSPDFHICGDCRKTTRDFQDALKATRRANGLCDLCGARPPVAPLLTCQKCRESANRSALASHSKARMEAIGAYGGKCEICSQTVVEFLQIDHINGGGTKHLRGLGSNDIYFWLRQNNYPAGFRLLCTNHNFALGVLYAQSLHQLPEKPELGAVLCKCQKNLVVKDRSRCLECIMAQSTRDRQRRIKVRSNVLDHYGWVCACCGESTHDFLQMDHIDGGGRKHLKEIGGSTLYFWLRDEGYPAGYQTLCANCNFAKGKYGCCPHQRSKP